MNFNIPVLLTVIRIILIPFFVLFFYLPFYGSSFISALLFVIGALTDWFDGFLARLWHQTTKFGAFLDPIADKIMVITALVIVIEYYHIWWVTLPSITMIIREFIITSIRGWLLAGGNHNFITVSILGKFKTASQMIALVGLLWRPNNQIEIFAIILLYITVILTFWSMLQYLLSLWYNLKNKN